MAGICALLHDIGVHSATSATTGIRTYLIKNGDLRGFDPEEIEVIALVARYHRQATPKRTHGEYA
jgi:exopolyphosphatase/guanosine-5'-triphosphate,3'-diphosphate pyrophosphatase